jgi:hypothetical protein
VAAAAWVDGVAAEAVGVVMADGEDDEGEVGGDSIDLREAPRDTDLLAAAGDAGYEVGVSEDRGVGVGDAVACRVAGMHRRDGRMAQGQDDAFVHGRAGVRSVLDGTVAVAVGATGRRRTEEGKGPVGIFIIYFSFERT